MVLNNEYYAIYHTNKYVEGEIEICHPCAPIIGIAKIVKTDSGFVLTNMNKTLIQSGSFGKSEKFYFTQLTPSLKVLSLNTSWMGMGEISEQITYFNTTDFSQILEFTTLTSNEGMFERDDTNFRETSKYVYKIVNDSVTLKSVTLFLNLETNQMDSTISFEKLKL